MGLGVTTLLVASSLIAGQASPAISTETTFMNQTINENKTYTEEDFPVDYTPEPCGCGNYWHDGIFDYYEDEEGIASSLLYKKEGVVSLTAGISCPATFHSRIDSSKAWLGDLVYTLPRGYGTFHKGDYDCYSFSLFEKREVTISISASSSDFHCKIAKYQDVVNDLNVDGNYDNVIYSKDTCDSSDMVFTDTLDAGSYLITMGRCSHTYDNIYYSIDFFSERVNTEYVNFCDLRYNKGLKAVIWSADYVPCSIANFASEGLSMFNGREGQNYLIGGADDYCLKTLKEKAKDNIIPTDIIYVWDNDLADQLAKIFGFLKDNLTLEYIREHAEFQKETDMEHCASVVFNIIATIALEVLTIENPLVSVITSLAVSDILNLVFSVKENTQEEEEEKINYLGQFLERIYDCMRFKRDSVAIQIPLFYRIKDEWDFWNGTKTHVYTGRNVFKDYDNGNKGWDFDWEFYHDISEGRLLFSNPDNAYGLGGSFYTLPGISVKKDKNNNPVKDEDGMYVIETDNNKNSVESCEDVMKEAIQIGSLHGDSTWDCEVCDRVESGDYAWFSYTASESRGHCVVARSNDPITMELFSEQVLGYNSDADKLIKCIECQKDTVENEFVCIYDMYLKKGKTLWVRLKGKFDYTPFSTPLVAISYEDDDGKPGTPKAQNVNMNHDHEYGYSYKPKYINTNSAINASTQHYSYCWKKDSYILQNHIYRLTYNIRARKYCYVCAMCGYSKLTLSNNNLVLKGS